MLNYAFANAAASTGDENTPAREAGIGGGIFNCAMGEGFFGGSHQRKLNYQSGFENGYNFIGLSIACRCHSARWTCRNRLAA
jgi:hypothetical protein